MDEPQPVEALLDGFPDAIRETGLTLRSLILRTVPGTVETIRSGWRWVAYSLPEGKRVRNFAWIGPERKHIHLGFEHGTLLADPDRLLHGAEERLKQFRYFTFEPSIDVDEAILADYLRRAADLGDLGHGRTAGARHRPRAGPGGLFDAPGRLGADRDVGATSRHVTWRPRTDSNPNNAASGTGEPEQDGSGAAGRRAA